MTRFGTWSGGAARFWPESAALHPEPVRQGLRNCRKLKAFHRSGASALRRVALLLLLARGAMGVDETSAWYVVRTKPRAEAFAAANLRNKHIEVFLPRLATRLRSASQRGPHNRAPVPRIPVRPAGPRAASTTWSRGRRAWRTCSASAMAAQRARRRGGRVAARPCRRWRNPQAAAGLRPGDPVEIRTGPFPGLLAIIDRPCSAAGRVQILLDLFRRQTRLELPASAVAPI